jgi:hypothetical protein
VTAPDFPLPRDPFSVDHLARWPMGAERVELYDGELVWVGDFDERDAVVARRAFPGHRVRVELGVGLIVGSMAADHEEPRQWVDADGTEWDAFGGMVLRRNPGERHWTLEPWTENARRRNREQLAAYRAEEWDAIVAEYNADPRDVLAAWHYLREHPIFWSWEPRSWRWPRKCAPSTGTTGHEWPIRRSERSESSGPAAWAVFM